MHHVSHANLPSGARERRITDTFSGWITDFIATYKESAPGAQAFLVEQEPNWLLPTHYHDQPQFQVVVAGSAHIGRHPVRALAVHYATAQTGYGPIAAGPDGLSYLTLRAQGDTGAWYLHKPGSRERMKPPRVREQAHVQDEAEDRCAELIAPREDGLAALCLRLRAGESAEFPDLPAHAGRFIIVTRGELRLGATQLAALGVAFCAPDESPVLTARADGAEFLLLQFPRPTDGILTTGA